MLNSYYIYFQEIRLNHKELCFSFDVHFVYPQILINHLLKIKKRERQRKLKGHRKDRYSKSYSPLSAKSLYLKKTQKCFISGHILYIYLPTVIHVQKNSERFEKFSLNFSLLFCIQCVFYFRS